MQGLNMPLFMFSQRNRETGGNCLLGIENKTSVWLYQLWLHTQFSSVAQSCPNLWDPMNHSTPGLPDHHQLPEFTQTPVHRVGNAIQPSHPLSSPFSSCPQSLPESESFPLSQLFTWSGQTMGVSASASPSNECPRLISFRMDWLVLLAVQGTLKSLLQHHSSKASILQLSAFFTKYLALKWWSFSRVCPRHLLFLTLIFP